MTARRRLRALPLLLLVLAVTLVDLPGTPASGADAPGSSAVSISRTITRTHLHDGHDQVVESRDFSLSVTQTKDLRGYQEIGVSWAGAHPTAGLVADQNAGVASQEEYPVVLLECSGVDDPSAPAATRLDPSTCWTATSSERFQDSFNTAFPPWRLDRYASAGERTAISGQPQPRPAKCFGAGFAERWVPFRASDGTVYPGGSGGCAGMAPEAANVGGLSLPSNTTYGVTGTDGHGSTKFDVWTKEINASLGCSTDVSCALVAVPIMGISCDLDAAGLPAADRPEDDNATHAAADLCSADGHFAPGQIVNPTGSEDVAVAGALWWSASNWRNRVTVPLTFAPSSNVCDVVSSGDRVEVYGSELMTQAALQWSPRFCLDPKLFRIKHVQTGEPEARTLLANGSVEAAFSSAVPDAGWRKPIVNAPTAFTGFAIAFTVDDAEGHPVATLRLTPRLLAKLLTQSYPAINAIKEEYDALSHNPLNITLDPEFIALNPGITKGVPASESASALLNLSSGSDVVSALTSYIQADPEARAWLDGAPDPWGMVVNPSYKDIELPVTTWPLLDSFEPKKLYASDTNDCLFNNPVPYLPLVAAPVARLGPIAQLMQFSLANAQTVCVQVAEGVSEGEKLVALGRQTPGFRFMLGVVALGDVHRFGLDAASLQTTVDKDAPDKPTDTTGRSFVAPTDAALAATAQHLVADDTTNSWPIPYADLRKADDAYPGALVVYTQVPVAGLTPTLATQYAQLLRFAADDGQTPGAGVGQLPAGYLPLTSANGLGALAAYTRSAADAVEAQSGTVPSVSAAVDEQVDGSGIDPSGGSGSTSSGAGPDASNVGRATTGGFFGPRPASVTGATPVLASAPATSDAPRSIVGRTLAIASRLGGIILGLLLLVAGAAATGAFVISLQAYQRAPR